MEGVFFNGNNGYIEGIVRGYRSALLTSAIYSNLTQCDTLEDLKLQLSATDYGNFLANVPGSLSTSIIAEKATQKLIDEFRYIRAQAVQPLSKFMDFITYAYMIDNVALLITGTLHERDTHELLERCHPLGWFESLPALCVATNVEELYNTVLIDTPLAPYFKDCLSAADLDDLNIEIIRNTLYRAYLEDFYAFCKNLSTPSNEVMASLLEFEADRRVINISLNSFGTEITRDERLQLSPKFGKLYSSGTEALASADDIEQVRITVESVGAYKGFFDTSNNKSLEDHFYLREMELCRNAFTQQFTYSAIWAWVKAKEQEIRNITWIAECIAQNQKERIQNYISVF
ncbi:V0 complex, c/d subunit of ATPase [Lipomyces orientalis]|uniref:V0 complex, c/d subunit of ATPase n=1 Tax=Lipomyces orientalis TaxID=1233043 RepID=A0ACC3TGC1_9ASCO